MHTIHVLTTINRLRYNVLTKSPKYEISKVTFTSWIAHLVTQSKLYMLDHFTTPDQDDVRDEITDSSVLKHKPYTTSLYTCQ